MADSRRNGREPWRVEGAGQGDGKTPGRPRLLGMLTAGADPARKISIVPRGHALGVTLRSG